MDTKPKPYAGPVFKLAPIVHLSDRLFGAFTACGVTLTDRVVRTRNVNGVTCLDCCAIDEQARNAAKPAGGA